MLGALVAAGPTTVAASRALRYETDFLPLFVLAGALAVWWLSEALARIRRSAGLTIVFVAVVLAAWSVWANLSLALIYQREYSAFQSTDLRAEFVDFQLDVNDALGIPFPRFRQGAELPVMRSQVHHRTNAPHGELFVVGDCQGLYISTGRAWEPVEEPLPGQARWSVTFGNGAPGERQPLWSAGPGPYHVLWAHWLDDDHVRFEFEWTGVPGTVVAGKPVRVDRLVPYELDVRLDPDSHDVEVVHDGRLLLRGSPANFDSAAGARLGRQPDPALGAVDWPGTIREQSLTPICDRLTRHDRG